MGCFYRRFGIYVSMCLYCDPESSGKRHVPTGESEGEASAPGNTEAALLRTVSDRTTVAEIDVQQLKDGTLLVMHDANFKRTMGKNLNVWVADAAALQDLNDGQRASWKYVGDPVPAMETMLLAAKGRIRLMIELKSTYHEKDLEGETLSLIKNVVCWSSA